jgi:hypothetical protein
VAIRIAARWPSALVATKPLPPASFPPFLRHNIMRPDIASEPRLAASLLSSRSFPLGDVRLWFVRRPSPPASFLPFLRHNIMGPDIASQLRLAIPLLHRPAIESTRRSTPRAVRCVAWLKMVAGGANALEGFRQGHVVGAVAGEIVTPLGGFFASTSAVRNPCKHSHTSVGRLALLHRIVLVLVAVSATPAV